MEREPHRAGSTGKRFLQAFRPGHGSKLAVLDRSGSRTLLASCYDSIRSKESHVWVRLAGDAARQLLYALGRYGSTGYLSPVRIRAGENMGQDRDGSLSALSEIIRKLSSNDADDARQRCFADCASAMKNEPTFTKHSD